MPEVQTLVESSPTEVQDPFNGQTPSLREFQSYRTSGEVPERFKPAEAAEPATAEIPAEGDEPEKVATESASENDQEPPEGIGNKARRRFEKILAEIKELKSKLAQQAKPDDKPAPSAAPQAQQIPPTRPEPTLDDKNEDGTLKYADYVVFVKDLGRWSAEQTIHAERQRDIQQKQVQQLTETVESARKRYGDEFESVLEPTAGVINSSFAPNVMEAIASSDVSPEIIYTLGTDKKTMDELQRLSKVNPTQAIKYIGALEAGIRQELAADEPDPATEPAPEPKKTSAPKPPAPVTGASSRAFDVSDDSLSPEQWMRKRNEQVAQRRKT